MRRTIAAWGTAVLIGAAAVMVLFLRTRDRVACGPGFEARAARCFPVGCPAPLESVERHRCIAPDRRVAVPHAKVALGPSDWEAEGRVTPRVVEAGPFWIDAFELTNAAVHGDGAADPLRAASGLTLAEAADLCRRRGGRLPNEDEWIVAAGGDGHRYPWGDTGAVCRRAAFGLRAGPCSLSGDEPDTVGAHTDGDSPAGVHDLSGNVAEWVQTDAAAHTGIAKGGSWRTELAADLRVWARLELAVDARDDRVGARCAYDHP